MGNGCAHGPKSSSIEDNLGTSIEAKCRTARWIDFYNENVKKMDRTSPHDGLNISRKTVLFPHPVKNAL